MFALSVRPNSMCLSERKKAKTLIEVAKKAQMGLLDLQLVKDSINYVLFPFVIKSKGYKEVQVHFRR